MRRQPFSDFGTAFLREGFGSSLQLDRVALILFLLSFQCQALYPACGRQDRLLAAVLACRGEKQALIAIECVRIGLVSRLILDRNTSHAIALALDRLEGGEARED